MSEEVRTVNGRHRYTERAQKVLAASQEQARLRGAEAMDTEHILLGLLQAEGSIALEVLRVMGIDPAAVQEEIDKNSERKPPISGIEGVTPGAKRVIQLLQEEATELGHTWIGTEHILLALIREGEGLAAQTLLDRKSVV